MAKYTMLLAEYLEMGGQLPASFALINGFEDLFIARYCDHEIGFETDALFYIKLELKADIYMQKYADKIQRLATAWGIYDNPVRVRFTEEHKQFDGGKQHGSTTELPFDSETAEPSVISDTDAYKNTEARATTEQESGETHDEAIASIEFLNNKVKSLIEDLLNEFKPLFMGVY